MSPRELLLLAGAGALALARWAPAGHRRPLTGAAAALTVLSGTALVLRGPRWQLLPVLVAGRGGHRSLPGAARRRGGGGVGAPRARLPRALGPVPGRDHGGRVDRPGPPGAGHPGPRRPPHRRRPAVVPGAGASRGHRARPVPGTDPGRGPHRRRRTRRLPGPTRVPARRRRARPYRRHPRRRRGRGRRALPGHGVLPGAGRGADPEHRLGRGAGQPRLRGRRPRPPLRLRRRGPGRRPDHPDPAPGDDDPSDDDRQAAGWTAVRAADLSFALTQLRRLDRGELPGPLRGRVDAGHAAATGHSLGGAAALLAVRQDPRFDAVVDIDGFPRDPMPRPFHQPALALTAANDAGGRREAQRHATGLARVLDLSTSPSYRLTVPGAAHLTFTDAPLYLPPVPALVGTLGRSAGPATTAAATAAFLDTTLRGRPGDLAADLARHGDLATFA